MKKIKLYKKDFKAATSNIAGRFYLPWDWKELQILDKMWPDSVPIEIQLSQEKGK